MLVLRGSLAHSHFRLERLLNKIHYLVPQVSSLYAEYVHLVDFQGEPTEVEIRQLTQLLEYDGYSTEPLTELPSDVLILVVPTASYGSPWSFQTTELIHHCGLYKIRKVERGIAYIVKSMEKVTWGDIKAIADLLHDSEIETVYYHLQDAESLFKSAEPRKVRMIDVLEKGKSVLRKEAQKLGLTLLEEECDHILKLFQSFNRNLSDVELKTILSFNFINRNEALFAVSLEGGDKKTISLNQLIKKTQQLSGQSLLRDYPEKTAIIEGERSGYFCQEVDSGTYRYHPEAIAVVLSSRSNVSLHASEMGNEISQIIATGRGACAKAGYCGYSVSHLQIPHFKQAWEEENLTLDYLPSALEIMLEVPALYAEINNTFGRPTIAGYFRTFEQRVVKSEEHLNSEGLEEDSNNNKLEVKYKRSDRNEKYVEIRGYATPLMILGSLGNMRQLHSHKLKIMTGMRIIYLGSPISAQKNLTQHTDFTKEILYLSGNPAIQRRCQETIKSCMSLGIENPIVDIHLVGRLGLANVASEFLKSHLFGAHFELRDIPVADPSLSPLEIWSSPADGYLLILAENNLRIFHKIVERENCPFAIIGQIVDKKEIQLFDRRSQSAIIDLPLNLLKQLFTQEPRINPPTVFHTEPIKVARLKLEEVIFRLLKFPCIADKSFLLTLLDRTATGLVVRDPLVGPWQVPVADCGVMARGYDTYFGEAVALGERPALSLINPLASARMAVGEAITNLAAAPINSLKEVHLAAHWIGSFEYPEEEAQISEVIKRIATELCPSLGIAILLSDMGSPIKHSNPKMLSTREKLLPSKLPLSVVMTAFAPVEDIRCNLTPQLSLPEGETVLIFIDLNGRRQRLGGSALAQVYNQIGEAVPDLDDPKTLKAFFSVIQKLNHEHKLLAYHDRSDGGLFVTICEMAFAAHIGVRLDISELGLDIYAILFNEELGAVIQVRLEEMEAVLGEFQNAGLQDIYMVGSVNWSDTISIMYQKETIFSAERIVLQSAWSETSYHLQAIRDNPRCAKKQFDSIQDKEDPGLNVHLSFDLSNDIHIPFLNLGTRPRLAILREQGSFGHREMAAAFDRVQFDCIDVPMNDLHNGMISLKDFKGLVACGGASYGDVLGAGRGWANRILANERLRNQFELFFNQTDTFSLGVSNGCQMLAHLKILIPGAELWPTFIQNYSEQFESRLALVEVQKSPSLFLKEMEGSRLLVPVAHRYGRAKFLNEEIEKEILSQELVALRYVDNRGRKTKAYPANPNGSPLGITGLTSTDGRVLIMMPHPDRVFRTVQHSWHPEGWGEDAPWIQLFRNARRWVG